MTIYVDNVGLKATVYNSWTGQHVTSKWYHLISDQINPIELHNFVSQLGLKHEYFQPGIDKNSGICNPGHDHFDLTTGKRRQAIQLGAKPVDIHELGKIIISKAELWHALVATRAEELREQQC